MINAISAADIAFIMSSSKSARLPSPLTTEWRNASPLFIEREIEKYVEDKDAKNTERSANVARQVFQEYLEEKKTTEPEEKSLLARGVNTF